MKDHILIVMGYFFEATENGVELNYNIQIEMVLKMLSKDFVDF